MKMRSLEDKINELLDVLDASYKRGELSMPKTKAECIAETQILIEAMTHDLVVAVRDIFLFVGGKDLVSPAFRPLAKIHEELEKLETENYAPGHRKHEIDDFIYKTINNAFRKGEKEGPHLVQTYIHLDIFNEDKKLFGRPPVSKLLYNADQTYLYLALFITEAFKHYQGPFDITKQSVITEEDYDSLSKSLAVIRPALQYENPKLPLWKNIDTWTAAKEGYYNSLKNGCLDVFLEEMLDMRER